MYVTYWHVIVVVAAVSKRKKQVRGPTAIVLNPLPSGVFPFLLLCS
jgi:hypothetical protein